MTIPSFRKPSRLVGWAFFLSFATSAAALAGEPEVRFARLEAGKTVVVEVHGLPAAELDALRRPGKLDWPAILSVRVAGGSVDLAGDHSIVQNVLRFESRHAPSPGISFQARFDPKAIPGRTDGKLVEAKATLAKPAVGKPTELLAIYPTAAQLAENHLRFYLHFSGPMSRGDAYRHLKLLREDDKPVESPFLELGEELWDATGTRFTLLFHPGRVKRELKPREDLGAVLEEGKRYTLVIDAAWPDAHGNALRAGGKKSFRAAAPDDVQPDPANWKITAPKAGTRDPLVVRFPEPLDHAMLQRVLHVAGVDAEAIRISKEETEWAFTPKSPWKPGVHRLLIDSSLEDRSGNSIARPFELDLVQPRPAEKAKQVEVKFEVK